MQFAYKVSYTTYTVCSQVTVHFCTMPSVTNVQPMDALLYSAIVSSKRAHTFRQDIYDVIITDLCVVANIGSV